MIIELLLFNLVVLLFPFMIFISKGEEASHKSQEFCLAILKAYFVASMGILIYIIYAQITAPTPIDYAYALRHFTLTIICLLFAFRLFVALDKDLPSLVDDQKLRNITLIILSIIVVMGIINEITIHNIENGIDLDIQLNSINVIAMRTLLGVIVISIASVLIFILLIAYKQGKIIKKELYNYLILPILTIVIFIVFFYVGGFDAEYFGSGMAQTEDGDALDFSTSSQIVSEIFFSVMQQPIIYITIVFMAFGAIPRAFPSVNPYITFIGNLMVSWLPLIIWLMAFLQTIPVPSALFILFADITWFAFIFWILLLAVIFITIIVVISLFTSMTSMM